MIPFVRDTPTLLAIGVIFGALNFTRTWAFRRRTGVSPWHIHPIFWGIFSLFISVFGTVLAAIAVSTTKVPRRDWRAGAGAPARVGGQLALPGAPAGPSPPAVVAGPAPGWHPDPSGHHHRFWDGTHWTEHVATDGVPSIDPVPPGANPSGGAAGALPQAAEPPLSPFRRP